MTEDAKPIGLTRTAAGLRDGLFDEWDRLNRGESNPQTSQAISKLATQIINSVKAEVEFHSHVRSLGEAASDSNGLPLQRTLQLGTLTV